MTGSKSGLLVACTRILDVKHTLLKYNEQLVPLNVTVYLCLQDL